MFWVSMTMKVLGGSRVYTHNPGYQEVIECSQQATKGIGDGLCLVAGCWGIPA